MKNKKVNIFLSAFFGISAAVVAFFFTLLFYPLEISLWVGLLFGAAFALSTSVFLGIYMHRIEKKYEKAETVIESPIFFKTTGNFDTGNGGLNGNIYFCDGGIVFISLEKKSAIAECIALWNIEKYEFAFPRMTIYCNDGRVYIICIADLEEAHQALIEKGWIVN